jgi:hypothetical protein
VSILVTFTEFLPLDSLPGSSSFNVPYLSGSYEGSAAVHCGSAMDLVTPAVGPAAVGYTFEPEEGGPVQLPPVWRCGCGFQLDAWIRSPYAHAQDGTAPLDRPSLTALSA